MKGFSRMNVAPVTPNREYLTPSKLLEQFKQGKAPRWYEHKDDVLMDELGILVKNYRQTMSLDAKKKVLEQEKKILIDGLKNPEMTLARNYTQILWNVTPDNKTPMEDILRLFDMTGLSRLVGLSGIFQPRATLDDVDALKTSFFKIKGDTGISMRVKDNILSTLSAIQYKFPDLNDSLEKTLLEMKEKIDDKYFQEYIEMILGSNGVVGYLDDLKINPDDENKLQILLANSKPNSDKDITQLVTQILKRKGVSYDTYEMTILGAGKFRSEENFEILKNIAQKKADKGARFKELALHSLALYIKEKPDEVKDILSQVKKEKSMYAPLATILLDKVTGNYHNQDNRELKYANLTKKQIDGFNKNKSKILYVDTSLNKRQINACDRFLLPFKKVLSRLNSTYYKYIIQSDTFTRFSPELSGKRYFEKLAGILSWGDFYDVIDGMNTPDYSVVHKRWLALSDHSNQAGHELGHAIERLFTDADSKTLKRLYNKALQDGYVLDNYAATNKGEYFAQGVEAFISVYKPHKDILNNSILSHTKYKLLAKDPELYKFVKKCLKKYC